MFILNILLGMLATAVPLIAGWSFEYWMNGKRPSGWLRGSLDGLISLAIVVVLLGCAVCFFYSVGKSIIMLVN